MLQLFGGVNTQNFMLLFRRYIKDLDIFFLMNELDDIGQIVFVLCVVICNPRQILAQRIRIKRVNTGIHFSTKTLFV